MNIAWVISIFFSFVIRFPNLFEKSYQWRPLQTEMTAYWFVKEGLNLLNYQTPLYGPPWQIPFEFPLFQAAAAILFKAGLGNFDFACRLTALLCFYLSALFLYLLCKKVFWDRQTNLIILSLYLWLPYNIYYSTEPLIDYLALALSLAYLYFIFVWLSTHSSWTALLATIFGSLGILVKPTTMPIVMVPIVVLVVKNILVIYGQDFKRPVDVRLLINKAWSDRSYWLSLILMATIPVLIGSIWTRHTDLIKDGSVFTQWLTSEALLEWNFGTWALRTDQNIWAHHIFVAERYLLPFGLSIFAVLGIFIATVEVRLFVVSVMASIGVTLMIFLNLYLHHYYYIALSASMAILGGYGLARFWQLRQKGRYIFIFVFAVWTILFLVFNINDYQRFRNLAISDTANLEQAMVRARDIQQYVPPDKWAVVVEYDWSPAYVYPLERKAMVVTKRELDKPLCKVLSDKRFAAVVVGDLTYDKNEELLNYAFKCFKSTEEVLPGVFVVTH
jgi:hypothetical protein